MEHEISPDYLPISPSSLRTNTTVGCDIFLLAKTTAEVRFVLYCRGDAVFDEAKKEHACGTEIKSLFIKKDEQKTFFDYLENNFQHIVSDTNIPPDERQESCMVPLLIWLKTSSMIQEVEAWKGLRRLLTTWLITLLKIVKLQKACSR